METNKWEQIEHQIRQLIDERSFEHAIELLKTAAIEKGNTLLQHEIEEFKKQFEDFKKEKQEGNIPPAEVQSAESNFAYGLYYFIECLQRGGATSAEINPTGGDIPDMGDVSPFVEPQPEKSSAIEVRPAPVLSPTKISEEKPQKAKAKAAKKSAKPPKTTPTTEGGILYNIPNKMQLGVQSKCIVRLAFDKNQLKRETDSFTDEVIKTVQVSEVMEIDLLDTSGEDAFKIQFISQKEQFIDKNSATEWLINVKALKAGSFSLALKVAIIEKIDDKDRRKEMVLEEIVAVVSDTVTPANNFKSSNQPFQTVSIQTFLPIDTPSVNTAKTVLFMGANPPGTEFLQLEIEHSRISSELEGKFRFPTSKFLSASEIPKLLIIHKPNIIHFSGHGKAPSVNDPEKDTRGIALPSDYEETGGIIVFDNDMRGMKVIEDKTLDFIFSTAVQKLKIPIEVVVFNSCHSESEAKVVGKSVPYVIGTARAIKDSTAIAFAVGFYFGLANGLNVEDAFTSGKMQAVIEDLEAENLIVLYKNGVKSEK